MKKLIYLALTLLSTFALALEINLVDENGNVLKDICGHKRNPNLNSIHTHIPYTQEECNAIAQRKQERKRKQHWQANVANPLWNKMYKQLTDGYNNFVKHLENRQKEVRKEMGVGITHKVNREIFQDHHYYKAYMMNETRAYSYFVTYEKGDQGVNDYIKWFNAHGFNLEEWRKICSRTPLESSERNFCEKEDKQGSYLVDIGHVGGPVYVYFYEYTPSEYISYNKNKES